VRFRDLDQRAGELSGGNIQRLIFARELESGLRLLIAAQPTRGLDVVATAFVHETLRGLAASSAGVLLVSSDLDELFELCDRIVVMLGGHIAAEFARPFTLAPIGAAMVGAA
jgi:simple sugar transport system ATP-binding protein